MRLVERRPTVWRLPRADAAALATDWPHVVEVLPTDQRGRYRLTARGWVGTFRTPGRTFEVVPKLGWEAVGRLVTNGRPTEAADPADGLRGALAARLAELMDERQAAGLVRGYAERPEHSAVVRGRIDFAARVRPAVGFDQTVVEFTRDQPWNGWPLVVADRLLAGPLPAYARTKLQESVAGFATVRPCPAPPTAQQLADPRLAGYRPLSAWCDLVAEALAGGGLLVNLERLFEAHVGRLLAHPINGRTAVPQRELLLRGRNGVPGVELRPDFTVYGAAGRPTAAWDVKWKALPPAGPRPDDLHQVLGYAAALGVRTAGLIYPGRRFAVRRYDTPGGVTLIVATCRLTGDPTRLTRAGESLRRLVLRA